MLHTVQDGTTLRRWRFLATAVLFLLMSACSFSPSQSKVEQSAALQAALAAGNAAWQVRDYATAQTAYAEAHRLAPADAALAFRLGYVFEQLGKDAAAASIYRSALQDPLLPGPLQQDFTYRLALLEAFRLHGEEKLPSLLATLPSSSPYSADLRAVQAILVGDGRQALLELNQARTAPLTAELSSIILYHAARAYHLTGETDRAMQSLYEAINLSEYAPVTKDITEFRELLLRTPRP